MGKRDRVVAIANEEIDKYGVTWSTHEERILEYFFISTGLTWTKKDAIKISWCTYFAHWVLKKAGVLPLPKVGTTNATGRFMKRYGGVYKEHLIKSGYQPKPGDLYFLGNRSQHIGIITGINSDNSLVTVNGNGGPKGFDARFDTTYGAQLGYGFVHRGSGAKLDNSRDLYLEIPD